MYHTLSHYFSYPLGYPVWQQCLGYNNKQHWSKPKELALTSTISFWSDSQFKLGSCQFGKLSDESTYRCFDQNKIVPLVFSFVFVKHWLEAQNQQKRGGWLMVDFCRSRKPSTPVITQVEEVVMVDYTVNLEAVIKITELVTSHHNSNALFRKGPVEETEILQ